MSSSAFLNQREQNIRHLLSQKKFQQAYNDCIGVIKEYPDEGIFYKLKTEIEEAVAEENQTIIDKKLEEIEPLWDNENYTAIIKELENLLKLSPANIKLQKLLQKAQTKYRKSVE